MTGDVRAPGADPGDSSYWSASAADLMGRLDATGEGLASIEAAGRLERHGANAVSEQADASGTRILLRQFSSPLVLILVIGAVVSLALRDWADAAIILAIVVGSALLGFTQEYRASAALAELRRRLALTVRARRDGALRTILASEIVPGDVVELSAGNLVA